ncbi:MAG: hypothetical protein ACRDUY_08205 [Nitriliruptorales bacterium]
MGQLSIDKKYVQIGDVITLQSGRKITVQSVRGTDSGGARASVTEGVTQVWGLDDDGEGVLAKRERKAWVEVDWTA